MKIAIFFSKLLLDSFRDTRKVCKYFKLEEYNNFLISVKIFFIKFFYSFETIRNSNKIKKITQNYSYKILKPHNNAYNILKTVEELDKEGHSQLFNIDERLINKITYIALNSEDFDKKKLKDNENLNSLKIKNDEEISTYTNRLKKSHISRLTTSINLKKDSELTEFLFSDEILKIAESYLNTKTISVNATFFISNPLVISETEKYKNAQYFHWDNDFTKFFKLYIYLNDVDEDTGPHVFVPRTHKKKFFSHKLCRLYSDKDILENYEKVRKFTGKKGSAFFVDGYGLHKGETPKKNYRLMLNVHYGRGNILYSKNDKIIKLN